MTLKSAFSAIIALLISLPVAAVNPEEGLKLVTYTSTDAIFANPERGLFKHIDFMASSANTLDAGTIRRYRSQGISLLYNGYILDKFRDGSDLSDEFLDRVRANMAALREAGLKAVIRFYYSADSNSKPWDMPLEVTCRHIEQLRPVLEDNRDVIALVEAGLVGVWGEWYMTDNHIFNPTTTADYEPRRRIVEALAEAVPADRFISVRTPMAKMGMLALGYSDTITAATAYDGTLSSRLGYHNDCFLANADDAGTYQNKAANRQFVKSESRYTPMGGETCSEANSYTEQANALRDFTDYHWSYLNADYHPGALSSWETSGFINDIKRRLGYRLELTEGLFSPSAAPGGDYHAKIELYNSGWASPFNARKVEIVLVGSSDRTMKHTFPIDVDPRRWMAGSLINLDITFTLPHDIAEGEYKVYLNLPDPSQSLYDRVEYRIRCANEDVWDARTGMNLLTSLTVSAASGMNSVSAPHSPVDGAVYDMSGRQVGRVSEITTLSPGLYIYNGLKIRIDH